MVDEIDTCIRRKDRQTACSTRVHSWCESPDESFEWNLNHKLGRREDDSLHGRTWSFPFARKPQTRLRLPPANCSCNFSTGNSCWNPRTVRRNAPLWCVGGRRPCWAPCSYRCRSWDWHFWRQETAVSREQSLNINTKTFYWWLQFLLHTMIWSRLKTNTRTLQ